MLALDFETFSALDVRRVGAEAYAAHASTGIHCAVLIEADIAGAAGRSVRWHPGDELPQWAVDALRSGPMLAHNWTFEFAVLRHILTPFYGWPEVHSGRWLDTAAFASALSLPAALEPLGAVLGAPVQKDAEGHELMLRLCRAVDRGASQLDHRGPPPVTPAELERLTDYCETDVRSMLAVWRLLPKPSLTEMLVWRTDCIINARGVMFDQALAQQLRRIATRRGLELAGAAFEASGHDIVSTAPRAVEAALTTAGVDLPTKRRANGTTSVSVSRATLSNLLGDPDLPEEARGVIEARLESGRLTSLAKLARVPAMVNADGRLRNALRYCGAHTGRWSSSGLQLHNLPRSQLDEVLAPLRAAALAGVTTDELQELAAAKTPRLLEALAWLLRSVVIAAPGCELLGCDYSAIEARVLAWLAGQDDVLATFADPTRDIYVEDAKRIGSDDRQLGKIQRLALGYGMGPVKFADTARGTGLDLSYRRAREVQTAWRENNPAIVGFWQSLDDAVRLVCTNPKAVIDVGDHLRVMAMPGCVAIELPSGRRLRYWRPHFVDVKRRIETLDDAGERVVKEVEMTEFRFYRARGGSMVLDNSYGGKLAENVTQAASRDILAEALPRLEAAGFPVVLHVHDSIMAEVPTGARDLAEFKALALRAPAWAVGLPLAAKAYRSPYFAG